MEQNMFLTKVISIVIAVIVAAIVLVPICNSLTEENGGGDEGGSAPEGAQLFRPVTVDDVIVFNKLDGGNGINVTVNGETVYDLTKPASPVPILYSSATSFGNPWNDADNPKETVEFTFKIKDLGGTSWGITYPSIADPTVEDNMYLFSGGDTANTMHFYEGSYGDGHGYEGALNASMTVGPEEYDCFNIQYVASPSGGDYYYDEASDKVVPIGGSSSDNGDLGTAGTLIKVIPIFVILAILMGAAGLFYQNRKTI